MWTGGQARRRAFLSGKGQVFWTPKPRAASQNIPALLHSAGQGAVSFTNFLGTFNVSEVRFHHVIITVNLSWTRCKLEVFLTYKNCNFMWFDLTHCKRWQKILKIKKTKHKLWADLISLRPYYKQTASIRLVAVFKLHCANKAAGCLVQMTPAGVGWASVCMSEELLGWEVAGPWPTLRVATC